MQLSLGPEEQRAWMDQYRSSVEQKVGEPAIAFLPFHRTAAMGAMAMHHVSPLAAGVMRRIAKKKAGGLPPNFILVLTAERIYAYTSKTTARSFELKEQLAVWERAGVRVSSRETSLNMQLTIESPAGDEKVICEATKSALTSDFFASLSGPAALAA